MKKLFSIMMVVIMCVMIFPMGISAEQNDTSIDNSVVQKLPVSSSNNYGIYSENYNGVKNATEDIEISSDLFQAENDGVVISSSSAKFVNENGTLKATFEVPENAMYNVVLYYRHFGETSNKIKIALSLDSQFPFSDCEELSLNRYWKDKSAKPQIDNNGNEFASEQIAIEEFRSQSLCDGTGVNLEAFKYYVSKGIHTLTVSAIDGVFELEKIVLKAPESLLSYSSIEKLYVQNGYKWFDDAPITIQGEDADLKNSKAIIDQVDKSSVDVFPNSPYKNLVNNIGGDNWSTSGESVIWKINVEQSGIYKLAFKYRQRGVINGVTYRKLLIDGKVPFSEASAIDFSYTTGWETKEFTNQSGEAYGVYLESGIHEIELCCTLGPISELYSRLENIVANIGDRYLKIIMITGETPDDNRDYELFKLIPEFNESLTKDKNDLLKLANDFDELNSGNSNQISASFRNMARVLDNMIEDKYSAHHYVSDYYTNYNTISAWLSDMCSMPLSIDSMELCSKKHECESGTVGFFGRLWFSVRRFIASFVDDYNANNEKSYDLRIWVNWGRDQAQILNSLIDNQFTPQSGINVNLEIVSMSVINGIISGNAPDLILHAPRSTPVNLAMRGALVDLSDFDDFNEVLKNFQSGAETPYRYKDGCYAIPDTQSFMVMYYRKDVLDELNLAVPTTWDEFIDVSTKILRNNMQVYLPYTRMNGTTVADAGVGSLSLFPSLLLQNNVDIYNSEKNRCNLDSSESIAIFDDWTKLYTDYRILKEANFYNRFRLGTMPLGISSYTLYTQIMTAAPEISGKWGISLIPGTVKEDGVIDHTISGAGTGACILNVSNHKDEAWEFIKWWTNSETQFLYSENLECVLGPIGRQTVSNVEAFKNLSWNKTDKAILLEQWENVVEVPEVPGSYYLSRGIDQAYWEVMNNKSTPKESLIKWSQIINAEITRKIKEYS